MARIEFVVIFSVTALYFAIVPWGVGPDKLMADAELLRGRLEQGGQIPFAVGKAVSKFESIVGLNTFHRYSSAFVPFHQPFYKVC